MLNEPSVIILCILLGISMLSLIAIGIVIAKNITTLNKTKTEKLRDWISED